MATLRANNLGDVMGTTNPMTLANASTQTASWPSAPTNMPAVNSPDILKLTLEPNTVREEIVYVTAYTPGATSGTVTRAAEGPGVAIAHNAVSWVNAPTVTDFPLPAAGAQGQALVKNSANDFDLEWASQVEVFTQATTPPSPRNQYTIWIDPADNAAGAQGSQGTQGPQGAIGPQGTQRGVGGQGPQGTTGVGSQGLAGAQGAVGAQGTAGTQGLQGHQGFQGATGGTGTSGSQGAQGAMGTGVDPPFSMMLDGSGNFPTAWTSNPYLTSFTTTSPASQAAYLTAIYIPVALTATRVTFICTAAPTAANIVANQSFVGIYSTNGLTPSTWTLVASSAAGALDALINPLSKMIVTCALSSPVALSPGFYYIVLMGSMSSGLFGTWMAVTQGGINSLTLNSYGNNFSFPLSLLKTSAGTTLPATINMGAGSAGTTTLLWGAIS